MFEYQTAILNISEWQLLQSVSTNHVFLNTSTLDTVKDCTLHKLVLYTNEQSQIPILNGT